MKQIERITIIGPPGSGKSTFAIELGKISGVTVYHLDKYMFNGKIKKEFQEFLLKQQELVQKESWIIEGCSISTLEVRFARADIVIYFRFSRWLCLWRVIKRAFTFDIQDFDSGCFNSINWALIKYIWTFDRDKEEQIGKLRKEYPNVKFILFQNGQEAATYLKNANIRAISSS